MLYSFISQALQAGLLQKDSEPQPLVGAIHELPLQDGDYLVVQTLPYPHRYLITFTAAKTGGETGIRTLETPFRAYPLSRRARSATPASLPICPCKCPHNGRPKKPFYYAAVAYRFSLRNSRKNF